MKNLINMRGMSMSDVLCLVWGLSDDMCGTDST